MRRHRLIFLAVGGFLLGLVFLVRQREPAGGTAAQRAERRRGGAVRPEPNAPSPLPDWFAGAGATTRRIGGSVTGDGRPLDGAVVTLSSALTDARLLSPAVTHSNSSGGFGFPAQPAQRYQVAARFPGRIPAFVTIDLRDPTAQPEALQLELGRCTATLFGRVQDAGGGVIVGARLSLRGVPGATVESDERGQYELCVNARERAGLLVEANGYGSIVDDSPVGKGRLERNFLLLPEGLVVGITVREDDGAPIPGASVQLDRAERTLRRGAALSAVSGDDGRFRIAGVNAGRYLVRAFSVEAATFDPIEVAVEATASSPELVLRLRPTPNVSGIVRENGRPLAGVRVQAGTSPPGSWSEISFSDANGSFSLGRVPASRVAFKVQDYEVLEPKSLVVPASGVRGVLLEVASMGSLAGKVTRAGRPVAGALVHLEGAGYKETRSEAGGNFVLRGMAPGNYTLFAESGDAAGRLSGIALGAGEARKGLDIELNRSGAIAGVVIEPDGKPIPGIAVVAHERDTSDRGGTTTAGDGSFEITALGAGHYLLTARRSLDSPQELATAGEPLQVELRDADTRVDGLRLIVQLDRQIISGRVVDEASGPLPDVRVVAARRQTGEEPHFGAWQDLPFAFTGQDGAFVLEHLAEGHYAVEARNAGSATTVRDVAAGRRDLVIRLEASGGVDGQLVDFRRPPDVLALRTDRPASMRATVQGSRFTIDSLPPGRYNVNAMGDGEGASATVDIAAGARASVTLRSHGSAALQGRVLEFRTSTPVGGVRCVLGPRLGEGRAPQLYPGEAWTDASGAFSFDTAPSGDAYVLCTGGAAFSDGVTPVSIGNDASAVVYVVRSLGPKALLGAVPDSSTIYVLRFAYVRPAQPAERAGIQAGDVVLGIDGADVRTLGEPAAEQLLRDRSAGTPVRLLLSRAGAPVETTLVVGRWQ